MMRFLLIQSPIMEAVKDKRPIALAHCDVAALSMYIIVVETCCSARLLVQHWNEFNLRSHRFQFLFHGIRVLFLETLL